MRKPYVLAIAGGSASGKSKIAEMIEAELSKEFKVHIFKFDDYYNKQDDLSFEQRLLVNYDHPDAYDLSLLQLHLKSLINNKSIEQPIYDFVTYNRSNEINLINPVELIIVEGIFALYFDKLNELYDLKVFVDVDSDIRLLRRIKRDVVKRGRSIESVMHQYQDVVKPMYEKFVYPSKNNADIIILKGRENLKAVNLLVNNIASILNNNLL